MKKEIIRVITLGLSLILLLCLLIKPIYKIDQEFIITTFDEEINEIMNQEPSAFFDHVFEESSFKKVNEKITLEGLSWEFYANKIDYKQEEDGVKINGGFRLVQVDFPDFVNLIVFASGNNSQAKLYINDKLIQEKTLTETMQRYEFEYDAGTSSKLEIVFSGDVTLQRIKINEYDAYTKEEAVNLFLRQVVMQTGLITTNQKLVNIDSYELYVEYINEEVDKLLNGVPFLSLLKMLIEDIDHNISLLKSQSNKSLSLKIKDYVNNRHCPLISIITFVCASAILGSIAYIVIRFILDLIFKKSSNYLICSLILLISFVLILNISTFTNINFFYGNHNVSNRWRILFFESSDLTISFIACAILALGIVTAQFLNILLDYLNQKNNKKLKKKVIINGSIILASCLLIIVGLIFH